MSEYLAYDPRLSDESDHAHRPTARTPKGVELEDAFYQICPSPPQSLLSCGAHGGLVFLMDFQGLPLIVTDGFDFYEKVARRVFGPAALYGQVVKTRRNDRDHVRWRS